MAKDGKLATWIENPNDIIVIESFLSTALAIKEEANSRFGFQNYSSALKRYDDAIADIKYLDTFLVRSTFADQKRSAEVQYYKVRRKIVEMKTLEKQPKRTQKQVR